MHSLPTNASPEEVLLRLPSPNRTHRPASTQYIRGVPSPDLYALGRKWTPNSLLGQQGVGRMEVQREATSAFEEFKCAARGGDEVRNSFFLGGGWLGMRERRRKERRKDTAGRRRGWGTSSSVMRCLSVACLLSCCVVTGLRRPVLVVSTPSSVPPSRESRPKSFACCPPACERS